MKFDLNCDLGEGEPSSRTRALMRLINSANIACGGHAGDERSMRNCVRWAIASGVRIGAHPGLASAGFGRENAHVRPAEFQQLVLEQVQALATITRTEGGALHHIKLHGALYHATDSDRDLRKAYLKLVAQHWPKLIVYARAGGAVVRAARAARVKVWEEAFVDRGYRDDGTLVPRDQTGALISSVPLVRERIRLLFRESCLVCVTDQKIQVRAQTLCVHGDGPNALALVRAARECLAPSD